MIKNLTKNTILAKRVEVADSLGKRMRGLMFRDSLGRNSALLMVFEGEGKYGIWMFGMQFAIDIVFIDMEKRIVDIEHSARPIGLNPKTWKIYRPKKPCAYVLELPAGTAERTGTEIGDVLDFE